MSRGPGIFILLMALAVGVFFAVDAYLTRTGKLPPENLFKETHPAPGQLPQNAKQLTTGVLPDSIIFDFVDAKDDRARADAAELWRDYWLPDEGWAVKIEEVRTEVDHVALRCWMSRPSIVGGGYMLIARLPAEEAGAYTARMEVKIFGRISQMQYENIGGLPYYRLIIEEASVLR